MMLIGMDDDNQYVLLVCPDNDEIHRCMKTVYSNRCGKQCICRIRPGGLGLFCLSFSSLLYRATL